MANVIGVMGESGAGKTTSMRNLPSNETFYIESYATDDYGVEKFYVNINGRKFFDLQGKAACSQRK